MLISELQELIYDTELFYDQLVEYGQPEPTYDIKSPENYVSGCQSSVWVLILDNKILVDSDAMMVRGIARVIVDFAEHNVDISFKDFHIIAKPLTTQRQRGMQSIINKIRELRGIKVVVPSQQNITK
jgi:sulfur transfer protein SufE